MPTGKKYQRNRAVESEFLTSSTDAYELPQSYFLPRARPQPRVTNLLNDQSQSETQPQSQPQPQSQSQPRRRPRSDAFGARDVNFNFILK